MIAADQNSCAHAGATLDAVDATQGCHGCRFVGNPCQAPHEDIPSCLSSDRKDGRSITWVARDFTANPATVAADILRAQGEDVDAPSVKRAEAACEDPAPPDEMQAYLDAQAERLARIRRDRESAMLLAGNGSENLPAADKLDTFSIVFDDPAYASLGRVLTRAYAQAATGKGAERHGSGKAFEDHPMQDLIRLHGVGFATGQAGKKSQEALRLPRARAVAELLGAINYLAGSVIAIEAGDTHHED